MNLNSSGSPDSTWQCVALRCASWSGVEAQAGDVPARRQCVGSRRAWSWREGALQTQVELAGWLACICLSGCQPSSPRRPGNVEHNAPAGSHGHRTPGPCEPSGGSASIRRLAGRASERLTQHKTTQNDRQTQLVVAAWPCSLAGPSWLACQRAAGKTGPAGASQWTQWRSRSSSTLGRLDVRPAGLLSSRLSRVAFVCATSGTVTTASQAASQSASSPATTVRSPARPLNSPVPLPPPQDGRSGYICAQLRSMLGHWPSLWAAIGHRSPPVRPPAWMARAVCQNLAHNEHTWRLQLCRFRCHSVQAQKNPIH